MDTLTRTIEQIQDAERDDRIHLGKVVDSFASRGFGPLLLIPSLITFLPTGGIPGVPAVCGVLIILLAGQLLVGQNKPWIPKRLARLSVERDRFVDLLNKSKTFTRKVDKVIKPRLQWITGEKASRGIAALIIVLAGSLIVLGPIPFAAAIPSGILVLISLGIVAKDGLLIISGVTLSVAAAFLLLR